MTEHHIRFEGAAADAMNVATAIADADGIELTSSEPPTAAADGKLRLDFTVNGPTEMVTAAVEEIGADLPDGALTLDPN